MHSTPTRKLFLYIAMSLDGYIAGPNDELDFLSQVEMEGEDYGYSKFCQQIDTVIIGKRSFDKVAAMGFEYPHLDKPVYIFTRQNLPSKGNCIYYSGDLNQLLSHIRSQPGKHIYCDGGAELANQLLELQLIDEIILSIIPVLLGKGIRLFRNTFPSSRLELKESKTYSSGLVQLHYLRKA